MSSKSKTTEKSPAPEAPTQEITLTGRLTADPKLRHTNTGKAVTTIRIAVNHGPEATFHSVVAWRRTAEVICEYAKKGRMVEVTGYPKQRSYTTAEGEQRTLTEIVARRVQFVRRNTQASPSVTSPEVA